MTELEQSADAAELRQEERQCRRANAQHARYPRALEVSEVEQDALAKEHRAVHSGVNDGQPLDETSVAKHRPLEIRADNSELVENQAPIDGKSHLSSENCEFRFLL
ncbi:MAG: hypothetical protein WBW73_17040 [Rhodoplanes sp.]